MLIFDQLRISDNGSRMYIDIHVNYASYFDNIMLDSVTVIPADRVSETYPDIPTEDFIYKKVYNEDLQVDQIVIDKTALNEAYLNWDSDNNRVIDDTKPYAKSSFDKSDFSQDLFFVFVKCKGTPDECTPCRLDEEITLGVVFDETRLYQMMMGYTKNLADTCNIDKGFIDLILLWNGFKASIETEHYVSAIDFWKKIFESGNNYNINKPKPCGCHG